MKHDHAAMPLGRATALAHRKLFVQEYAKKLLECATTDGSKSFAHVLHGNVYFHSAPAGSIKDPKQEEKRFTVCPPTSNPSFWITCLFHESCGTS